MSKAKVYESLEDVFEDGGVADGERVYEVDMVVGLSQSTRFVRTNSPGNAALALVRVETVTRADLYKAAMAALGRKAAKERAEDDPEPAAAAG